MGEAGSRLWESRATKKLATVLVKVSFSLKNPTRSSIKHLSRF
jgi:hypothetical protein